jgi:hypothetical protein
LLFRNLNLTKIGAMATGIHPPVAYGSLRTDAADRALTPLGGTYPLSPGITLRNGHLSTALVIQFLGELDRIKKMSGSLNEQTIRPAFRSLLRSWANSEGLFLLEEHEYETKLKTKVYPDGTIVHDLRVPLGYWEAKDTKDD